jgi:hypothetical protein
MSAVTQAAFFLWNSNYKVLFVEFKLQGKGSPTSRSFEEGSGALDTTAESADIAWIMHQES